jgi:RNA polymerase sigma factor (sigma-70 family)
MFYKIKEVNAWQIIWRDLKTWLHRKRIFAMDVDAYEKLRLMAESQKRSPQEVAAQLIDQAACAQETQTWVLQCWERLSPRQQQISAHVCQGETTRQIAAQLNISQTTVKSHVEIILRKFGVNSRVALRGLLASWDLKNYL